MGRELSQEWVSFYRGEKKISGKLISVGTSHTPQPSSALTL